MTDADVTMLQLSPLTQTSGSTPNQSPEFHEKGITLNMQRTTIAGYPSLTPVTPGSNDSQDAAWLGQNWSPWVSSQRLQKRRSAAIFLEVCRCRGQHHHACGLRSGTSAASPSALLAMLSWPAMPKQQLFCDPLCEANLKKGNPIEPTSKLQIFSGWKKTKFQQAGGQPIKI